VFKSLIKETLSIHLCAVHIQGQEWEEDQEK